MITVSDNRHENIIKIVELTNNLTDLEVRDLTNIAVGLSLANKHTNKI